MSYEFYYHSYENPLGSLAHGKWQELQKLLPLLVSYVNDRVGQDWGEDVFRNVSVTTTGTTPSLVREGSAPKPAPFVLEELLSERGGQSDEVYVENARELLRLFEWCEFLLTADGAFQLYKASYLMLRSAIQNIERLHEQCE